MMQITACHHLCSRVAWTSFTFRSWTMPETCQTGGKKNQNKTPWNKHSKGMPCNRNLCTTFYVKMK